MRNKRWLMIIVITLLAAPLAGFAQEQQQQKPASPPGTATLMFADGKTVTIEYSRPSMRSRKIFGGLVPYDQVWRTGANAATSLKTDVDLDVGGKSVPKGSYTIY